eukprot:Clim_evm48s198 gene=Clim_evmTU48s198
MYTATQQRTPGLCYIDGRSTCCELRVVWIPGGDFSRFSTMYPEELLEGKVSRIEYDEMITRLNKIVDQVMNEYRKHYKQIVEYWGRLGILNLALFPFRYVHKWGAEPGHRRKIEALEADMDTLITEYNSKWIRNTGVSIGINQVPISDHEREVLKRQNEDLYAWRRYQRSEPIVVIRNQDRASAPCASTSSKREPPNHPPSIDNRMDRTMSETTVSLDSIEPPPPYAPRDFEGSSGSKMSSSAQN